MFILMTINSVAQTSPRIVQDPVLGSIVSAQLFGHVHKDEIRILPKAPRGAGPIFLSSSLSPVYYNNPSFKSLA